MTQLSTSIPTDNVPELSRPQVQHHHHHHHHDDGHTHTHGIIDPEIITSARGLWAVKWSLVGLLITAVLQAGVFWLSGSVALLADLIHNVGDAMTAVPLGVAFMASRRKPTPRFSYGFARLEDLAGVMIVAIVLLSAVITAYESVERFYHPQPLHHLGTLAIAAIVGFIGNEVVAVFRIRVGREINSAALIADGYHAMADGLVSLAVLLSAAGVSLGYSWADPVMGLVITVVLLKIVWESGQTIFSRLLDGVEPEVLESVHHAINHVSEVEESAIANLRTRWLGHRLHIEMDLMMPPSQTLQETQEITHTVEAQLKAHLPYLGLVVVRAVPLPQSEA
ncbi:MAG: cation diffusion facilitator family transporter [Nostocaceae cyanobacterium]|nr:cation diffusion facilitator family transporter [Nostocaceae cyanobacterium]